MAACPKCGSTMAVRDFSPTEERHYCTNDSCTYYRTENKEGFSSNYEPYPRFSSYGISREWWER